MSTLLPVRGTARGRKRLLVVVPGEEYSGAERYAFRIAVAAQSRFEVSAAVRPVEAMRPLRRDLAAAGVRTLQMAEGRRLRGTLGLVAMIELYRPAVIHLTLPWPLFAGPLRAAIALTGVPALVVHQLVPRVEKLEVGNRRWLYALARRRVERWVAVSEFGRRVLTEAFSLPAREQITVIHNAPRVHVSATGSRSTGDRHRFGLEPEDQVVVAVGRLSHEKGHDLLIAATAALRARFPRLRTVIAGDGKARERLERTIAEQQLQAHVRLLGQIDDVDDLLRCADVFAFPSRWEGTPFAMLEAMSLGLPVVATSFGGADEIIESGTNGLLVATESPEDLAAGIEKLLTDPATARTLGERGQQLLERFSERTMIDRTLDALDTASSRVTRQ